MTVLEFSSIATEAGIIASNLWRIPTEWRSGHSENYLSGVLAVD